MTILKVGLAGFGTVGGGTWKVCKENTSEIKDKNLNCIPIIQNLFKEDVGFSGHGTGATGTLGAVALGSDVIEKHVTLSRSRSGPDQAASFEFDEVVSLINEVQETGRRFALWDATNNLGQSVSAGMYIYAIKAGEFIKTKKMVLLK